MNSDAFGFGERIAQFEESDVRILLHQLSQKLSVRPELAAARWGSTLLGLQAMARAYLGRQANSCCRRDQQPTGGFSAT